MPGTPKIRFASAVNSKVPTAWKFSNSQLATLDYEAATFVGRIVMVSILVASESSILLLLLIDTISCGNKDLPQSGVNKCPILFTP